MDRPLRHGQFPLDGVPVARENLALGHVGRILLGCICDAEDAGPEILCGELWFARGRVGWGREGDVVFEGGASILLEVIYGDSVRVSRGFGRRFLNVGVGVR
jgi:hypothetical protein